MIKKYWAILEWLVNHKMKYVAALIYTVTVLLTFPLLIVLMGWVSFVETGFDGVIKSTLKGFWKGNK